MGLTKSNIFTKDQNELAALAKAIGHPARVAILQHLIKLNSCVCGDLVEEIGLAQPTISQHLKELKNQKLIQGSIEGTSVCYCINTHTIQKVKTMLNLLFDKALSNNESCC